jgi:hypothetical protein
MRICIMQSQSRELHVLVVGSENYGGVASRRVSGEDRVVTLGDVTFRPGK